MDLYLHLAPLPTTKISQPPYTFVELQVQLQLLSKFLTTNKPWSLHSRATHNAHQGALQTDGCYYGIKYGSLRRIRLSFPFLLS